MASSFRYRPSIYHLAVISICYNIDTTLAVATPFHIPAKDPDVRQEKPVGREFSILEGNADAGDAGDFLAYTASGVGNLDGKGREATSSTATAGEGISLLDESARLAVSSFMDSSADHAEATRAIYTTDSEAHSFSVVYRGGVDGMQLILWGCVAALISILAVSAIFVSMQYSHQSLGDPGNRSTGTSDTLQGWIGQRSRRSHGGATSVNSFSVNSNAQRSTVKSCTSVTSDAISSSEQISSSSAYRTPGGASTLPGLPLCPLLIVPDGTRLACIVQNDVRCRKQELSFDIGAVPARGGVPLFRVRVSELGNEHPGIYVETLSGREQLAVLSTEELWRGVERPALSISRPWGLPYGTIQKGENGEYFVVRGTSTLLIFAGDFASHSIRVMNASENTVATTMRTSPEEYQVHMQARTDAGLIILGLLAIDKCETSSDPAQKSSSGTSSEVAQLSS